MTDKKQPDTAVWNDKEVKKALSSIVDFMAIMAENRESITSIVTELSAKTGISKPLIRKAATAIYKENYDKLDEEDKILKRLLDAYNT